MELKDKTFLILGGSGVFGAEFTNQLSDKGANVLATATTNESAARIPNKAGVRLLLDLTKPESIETLVQYLLTSDTELDGIINASGVVAFGPSAELTDETRNTLFAVNTLAPMRVISELLPALKKSAERKAEPVVVTISGVVAEGSLPGLATYAASKAALSSFIQGASREWRRDGIRAFDARPGHTETGLATRAIQGEAPKFPEGMTAEYVVTRIMKAIMEDEKDLPSTAF